MTDAALAEVHRWVAATNIVRWQANRSGPVQDPTAVEAERKLESLYRTSRNLAVYGTLAPGRFNHHVIAHLKGKWTDGLIEGDLFNVGWGATLGYPAVQPRNGAPLIPVRVLESSGLRAAWPMLDNFEGTGYRRILVPVVTASVSEDGRLHTVANIYAAADVSAADASPDNSAIV